MSECTNVQVGEMLHAYELGMLRNGELERFEMHILECKFCCEELRQSQTLARVMTSSPHIKADAQRLGSDETASESSWKNYLWPQNTFVLLRPALLLLLIAVLAYPAYRSLSSKEIEQPMIMPIERQVSLVQTRSVDNAPQVRIDERTSLSMRFPHVTRNGEYILQILRAVDGAVVFSSRKATFDESLITSVVIEPNSLAAGDYLVRLTNSDGSGNWEDLYFRAVPVITNPPQ